MKWTRENTTAARGYSEDSGIRECPRCYGGGLTRYNQDGTNEAGEERTCQLCEGFGVIALQNTRNLKSTWEKMTEEEKDQEFIRLSAATLGRRGGQSKSPAKQAASRLNGRKGGRPKRELV